MDLRLFFFFFFEQEYRLKDGRGGSKRKIDVRTFTKDETIRWRIKAAEEEVQSLIAIPIRIKFAIRLPIPIPIEGALRIPSVLLVPIPSGRPEKR